MRIGIISDIHANVVALEHVLQVMGPVDTLWCLGDVVGYNANPKQCLDLVREMNIPCVKGNHDEYCSSDTPLDGFNPAAAEAVNWTRQQLTEDDRQWLRELKYVRMVTNFSIVHATLDGPQRRAEFQPVDDPHLGPQPDVLGPQVERLQTAKIGRVDRIGTVAKEFLSSPP